VVLQISFNGFRFSCVECNCATALVTASSSQKALLFSKHSSVIRSRKVLVSGSVAGIMRGRASNLINAGICATLHSLLCRIQ
jgi:hypothetical protein